MNLKKIPAGLTVILALSAVLTVCGKDIKNITGGGGGENPPPVTGTPAVSWGVMKKGSVIVNGVSFDTGGAEITHDNSPASDNLLQDGMNVKVRGNVNDDGVTGAAAKIRTDSEVRGAITGTAVDSVTVLGQQAFVDSRTVYANSSGLLGLALGQQVEVHGIRDPLGRLLATRIELLAEGSGPPGERLKGVVEAPLTGGNPPALTFTLRGITVVTTDGTLIQPAGVAISVGDSVAVHGFVSGATFTAGRIDREDLEDAEFEPQESEEFKVEGFVSGFTNLNADFVVGAVATRLTATTRFESGIAADLVNNVRIEVEGSKIGDVLQADKVKFDDADRFEANADEAQKANVLGKTVVVTSRTELSSLASVTNITLNQGLRIRGFTNPDGTVTATLIEGLNRPVDPAKIIIQGVVDDVSLSARTVTILGIVIDAAGATEVDQGGQVITLDQFFAQLTKNRSVVKTTGTFIPGTPPRLTATGVEIE